MFLRYFLLFSLLLQTSCIKTSSNSKEQKKNISNNLIFNTIGTLMFVASIIFMIYDNNNKGQKGKKETIKKKIDNVRIESLKIDQENLQCVSGDFNHYGETFYMWSFIKNKNDTYTDLRNYFLQNFDKLHTLTSLTLILGRKNKGNTRIVAHRELEIINFGIPPLSDEKYNVNNIDYFGLKQNNNSSVYDAFNIESFRTWEESHQQELNDNNFTFQGRFYNEKTKQFITFTGKRTIWTTEGLRQKYGTKKN